MTWGQQVHSFVSHIATVCVLRQQCLSKGGGGRRGVVGRSSQAQSSASVNVLFDWQLQTASYRWCFTLRLLPADAAVAVAAAAALQLVHLPAASAHA
jgi:hypothetical protein